jgi:hypothetical protein
MEFSHTNRSIRAAGKGGTILHFGSSVGSLDRENPYDPLNRFRGCSRWTF